MKVHPAKNKSTSILIKQEEIKSIHEVSLGSDRRNVALKKSPEPDSLLKFSSETCPTPCQTKLWLSRTRCWKNVATS